MREYPSAILISSIAAITPYGHGNGMRSSYRPYRHTVPRVVPAPPQPVAPVYPAPVYAAPQALQRGYSMPPSHVNWCAARWRTYTAYDNSYQPGRGVRSQCISPFWR